MASVSHILFCSNIPEIFLLCWTEDDRNHSGVSRMSAWIPWCGASVWLHICVTSGYSAHISVAGSLTHTCQRVAQSLVFEQACGWMKHAPFHQLLPVILEKSPSKPPRDPTSTNMFVVIFHIDKVQFICQKSSKIRMWCLKHQMRVVLPGHI